MTDRLVLRGFVPEDRVPFGRMNADPEVMEFMSRRLSPAESDAFLDRIVERWIADGFGLWAVERRADAAFIGFAGLSEPRFEAPFVPAIEVGWRLAREAWAQGFATEAGAAALRFGFEVLGRQEIASFTAVQNVRSRRVMEKLGLSHDPADDFDYPNVTPDHPIRRQVLYRIDRATWTAAARAPHLPSAEPA